MPGLMKPGPGRGRGRGRGGGRGRGRGSQPTTVSDYPDGDRGSSFAHRVDPETITYFEELEGHLKTLEDPEEISILISNALEEAQGKEVKVVTDAACSRVLETLLAQADGAWA